MIRLENLNKSYISENSLHVLKDVNLHIKKGEMVALMGSSGSGKSTLLNILGLLDNYDTGKYYLDGQLMYNLSDKTSANIRNSKIGFVFQSFNLINYKTVIENISLPLYYRNISGNIVKERAIKILNQLNLIDKINCFPSQLSGGQKQRVAIARAVITNPSIILADEPTGALDESMANNIISILRKVNQTGVTILIVTHDYSIAKLTDKIFELKYGKIF